MKERLEELFNRYISRTTTPEEESELMTLWLKPELEDKKGELIDGAYDNLPHVFTMNGAQAEDVFSRIMEKRAPVRRMNWKRIAVAASVLLILGLGGYLLLNKKTTVENPPVIVKQTDVKAPETNRAMITLADGRQIFLDSLDNGRLAVEQNVIVSKTADGQITYQKDARLASTAAAYNTLTNPRGSKVIDMTLSDGSRVWLNAGSSVTYPVAFISNERKVSITGEAYFEVAHDAKKPFKVGKGEMEVTVLGTHFNVNAYDDEADIKVTLLEGSVRTAIGNGQLAILKPGQQALIGNVIKVEDDVDTDQVMAWKNGKFDFGESTSLQQIMRQIARWYDVEIEYKGNIKQEFGGGISRQVNVSKVLEKFELTGKVKFIIEGKKVIVSE